MSATSFVKKWDSPEKTRVSGLPPGPDATISHTARGEVRRHDVHAINPYYKTDPSSQVPNGGVGLHISRESKIEPKQFTGTPDYKLEKEQESYKLNIIDPKVNPHSSYNAKSTTLPAYFRKQPKSTDFPSAHSKRSFLKLTPLEPRRLRSLETKNITPHDYLSESLERHRAVSMSPLRENLKVNERDVNQQWNAARRPGPKIQKESTFQKTTEESLTRGKFQESSEEINFSTNLNNSQETMTTLEKIKALFKDIKFRLKKFPSLSKKGKENLVFASNSLDHQSQEQLMVEQLTERNPYYFDAQSLVNYVDTDFNSFRNDKITDTDKVQVKWKRPIFVIVPGASGHSFMKSQPTTKPKKNSDEYHNFSLTAPKFYNRDENSRGPPFDNEKRFRFVQKLMPDYLSKWILQRALSLTKFFKKPLRKRADYTLHHPKFSKKLVTNEKYFPIIEAQNERTDLKSLVKTSKLHPMEPVSELEISRQEQKSDSAYSSHVTPNQRITPALSNRSPAHSSRSPAHSRHRSNSPKKIIFEGRHPPSSYVGLYTQLDLLPQKLVYENEPVQAEVDAKNDGPHTDIVPAKVHHLRDLYLNKVDDGVVPTTEIIVTNDYYQPAQQAPDNERKLKTYVQPSSTAVHKTNRIEHSQLISEQNLKTEQIRIEQELLEVENKRRLKELQLAQQKLQAEREAFDAKLRQDEQERERLRYVEQRNFAETEQRLRLQEQEQQRINQERKKLQQENDFDREQQRLQMKYQELQRQKEAYEKQRQSFENSNHIKITTVEQYRPPPNLNDSSSWQYTTSNNFSPRSLISVNGHDHGSPSRNVLSGGGGYHHAYTLEQTRTVPQQPMWPFPAVLVPVAPSGLFNYEVKEEKKSNVEYEHRRPRYYEDDGSKQSTMIKVKDMSTKKPKTKSIIKQKENWESHRAETLAPEVVRQVIPKLSETTNTIEETKRTEEVERRVLASEKKKSKKNRLGNRSYVTHTVHTHERRPHEADYHSGSYRDHAITQTGHRSGDSFYRDSGAFASRHGRDDFYTNGSRHGHRDVRKTHSSRDIYGNEDDYISGPRPIVEYPPTLPRSEDHYAERGLVRRSNSMNDWTLQPRYYQDPGLMNRYGEFTTDLERDFRDSLLMPLPHGQNINEKEYREERIPGGHESFSREVKANAGSRTDNPNDITHFSESKQEVSFKREQMLDR